MKRATYEDVLNAPENKVAEILDGELVLSPRPALRHARAASRLGAFLGDPFDRGRGGPGGWTLLPRDAGAAALRRNAAGGPADSSSPDSIEAPRNDRRSMTT
jgi:hypothetical protein